MQKTAFHSLQYSHFLTYPALFLSRASSTTYFGSFGSWLADALPKLKIGNITIKPDGLPYILTPAD
jgi:hypothetical protein